MTDAEERLTRLEAKIEWLKEDYDCIKGEIRNIMAESITIRNSLQDNARNIKSLNDYIVLKENDVWSRMKLNEDKEI